VIGFRIFVGNENQKGCDHLAPFVIESPPES